LLLDQSRTVLTQDIFIQENNYALIFFSLISNLAISSENSSLFGWQASSS
jgi:hypothetical protein